MTPIQFIMAETATIKDPIDDADASADPDAIADADTSADPNAIADASADPDAIADAYPDAIADADPDAAVTSAPALNHEHAAVTSPVVTGCNECTKCKNRMSRDYLCQGCEKPIHWFCSEGDKEENEGKGHGKYYWCHPCYQQQAITVTQYSPVCQ
jgi:hypothetical protein